LLLGVGDVLTALTVQLGSMVAVDVVPNSRGGRGWLTSVHVGSERGSESSRGGERGSGRPCANAGVVSSSKIQPKNPAGAKRRCDSHSVQDRPNMAPSFSTRRIPAMSHSSRPVEIGAIPFVARILNCANPLRLPAERVDDNACEKLLPGKFFA